MQSASSCSPSIKSDVAAKPVKKKKLPSKTCVKGTSDSVNKRKDPEPLQSFNTGLPVIVFNDSPGPSCSYACMDDRSMFNNDQSRESWQSLVFAVEEGKCWYDLLENKIGLDVTSGKWIEDHVELACKDKSQLIIRLAYELCLAEDTRCGTDNDSLEDEVEDGKCSAFDSKKIFALFEVVRTVMDKSDRKRFVQFVCRKGEVQLLKMIFQQESKDKGYHKKIKEKFPWKGEFTGYETQIELLHYTLKQSCSPAIVLCIAKEVYGTHHNVICGRQFLERSQIQSMNKRLGQPDLLMEECLRAAIKLGYRDVVFVMLGGDIYHCIRLMSDEQFQDKRFLEALHMVEETVADIISSWDRRPSFKDEILGLFAEAGPS